MSIGGPFVAVAALCENVLDEKDGRISCIRFLDRIELNTTLLRPLKPDEPSPTLPIPLLQVSGFLAFKSGEFRGKKVLLINVLKPSGEIMKGEDGPTIEPLPLLFEGDEHGVQVILRLSIKIKEEGLFYIEALLDGEPAARIPLRVVFTHTQTEPSQPPSPTQQPDTP